MRLSIVIVNYNSRDALLRCLDSLAADAAGVDLETLVVDNASRDGSREALAEHQPPVRTIANDQNLGYARAVNQGIAATAAPFVLVMNPDCVVRPGTLSALLGCLEHEPGVAIAAPKILNPDGTLEYSARGFPDHTTFLFNRYSLLTRLFPNNPMTRRYLMTDWDHASRRDVDWVSGACMMVRRAAVEGVGPMDETFFMFNEDVDWCRRMKLGGWRVTYVPEACVVHDIGASRRKVAARVIYERHRGMIHYFHKHHPAHPFLTFFTDAAIMLRAGLMMTANALRWR